MPRENRTRIPNNQAATVPRLKTRSHRDRITIPLSLFMLNKTSIAATTAKINTNLWHNRTVRLVSLNILVHNFKGFFFFLTVIIHLLGLKSLKTQTVYSFKSYCYR
jgi:hypothetical protein